MTIHLRNYIEIPNKEEHMEEVKLREKNALANTIISAKVNEIITKEEARKALEELGIIKLEK